MVSNHSRLLNRLFRFFVFGFACCVLLLARAEQPAASTRTIAITARRFSYMPSEVTLKKGETVTLVFHTEDVTHGFILPEWKLRAEIHKNHPVKITVQPDSVGTFEARCSYFCGVGHGSMRLFFHVVE
jgi:cytochrome c oxidase subunit II